MSDYIPPNHVICPWCGSDQWHRLSVWCKRCWGLIPDAVPDAPLPSWSVHFRTENPVRLTSECEADRPRPDELIARFYAEMDERRNG